MLKAFGEDVFGFLLRVHIKPASRSVRADAGLGLQLSPRAWISCWQLVCIVGTCGMK